MGDIGEVKCSRITVGRTRSVVHLLASGQLASIWSDGVFECWSVGRNRNLLVSRNGFCLLKGTYRDVWEQHGIY